MNKPFSVPILAVLLTALVQTACGNSGASIGGTATEADGGPPTDTAAGLDESNAEEKQAPACKMPTECVDLDTEFFNYAACCSPATDCGYEFTFAEEFFEVYPNARAALDLLTVEDPEGKCVPASFLFGERPGLYKHRADVEDGMDVLITPECTSRSFLIHTLPGCCMPNNECGISTDETWHTLGALVNGAPEPFTSIECVTAAELNQQFRDSGALAAFAHLPDTSGTCDYAALETELPPWDPDDP